MRTYLTDDYRVMLERGEELLTGIRILARALGAERVMVGIENNKPAKPSMQCGP